MHGHPHRALPASSTYPPAFLTFIGMCGAFPVRWISVMNGSPRSNSGMRLRLLNRCSIHIRPGLPDSVFSSDATTAGVDDWPRTSDRRHIRAELYQLSYINTLFGKTWQAALLSHCLFTAYVFAPTSELVMCITLCKPNFRQLHHHVFGKEHGNPKQFTPTVYTDLATFLWWT